MKDDDIRASFAGIRVGRGARQSGALVLELRRPSSELIAPYVAALERGWQPGNYRGEEARLSALRSIAEDRGAFLKKLEDGTIAGPPVGLPGLVRWLWDGEICGLINLRWQPGTDALPPDVLGHVGYTIAPWKRRRGYATRALIDLLPVARAQGLGAIEVAASAENPGSWKVIENAGGVLEREATGVVYHRADEVLRFYRIAL